MNRRPYGPATGPNTPHRIRFIARRLIIGNANDGDMSEAASLLSSYARDLEEGAIELEPIPDKPDMVSYGLLLAVGFLLGFLVALAALA